MSQAHAVVGALVHACAHMMKEGSKRAKVPLVRRWRQQLDLLGRAPGKEAGIEEDSALLGEEGYQLVLLVAGCDTDDATYAHNIHSAADIPKGDTGGETATRDECGICIDSSRDFSRRGG